jgi:hypothetical protein
MSCELQLSYALLLPTKQYQSSTVAMIIEKGVRALGTVLMLSVEETLALLDFLNLVS